MSLHLPETLQRHGRLIALGLLAALILALTGAAYLYRQQLQEQRATALRETAQAKTKREALDRVDSAELIGRFGVLADAARAHMPQNTVEISDALESLQREQSAPLRLSYRINEPVARAKAVAGQDLADRMLSIELGSVTEAPIPAFLMGLSESLNGAINLEQLEIERKLPYNDDLMARLNQGEKPDVLLTRVQLRLGSIVGPAAPKKAQP